MRIGIVGLGRLGESLARGLTRGGGEVFGFTRTVERGRQIAARVPGFTLLESPREVFDSCDPVFVWMKPSDAAELLAAHHDVIAARQPLLVSCHRDAPLAAHTDRWAESLPNVNLATGQGVTLLAFPPGAARCHLPAHEYGASMLQPRVCQSSSFAPPKSTKGKTNG